MTELERAQDELTRIRAAIDGVLSAPGQSYTVGTRSFTKMDLAALGEREAMLAARIGRLTRGGIRIQQIVPL